MNKLDFSVFPVLTTERLALRQLTMNDDKLIYHYQSDKSNFPYVDMPIYKSIDDARNYISKMNSGVAKNQWIVWAIADASTDTILGTICIWNISQLDSKAEVGYGLFQGNRGKGFMSEALSKVVEYGLNAMGLKTIEAYTNVNNSKSIELLKKNNFSFISNFKETETLSGAPMDMVIYAITQ